MEQQAKKAIADFREGAHKDWTKVPTTVPGVFIVYMPIAKGASDRSLGVEFNPTDAKGNPTKRRGIYLRSSDLAQLKAAMNNDLVADLVAYVESINPATPSGSTGDVIAL